MMTALLLRPWPRTAPLLLAALLAVATGCSTTPEATAVETLREGILAARAGQMDEAVVLLERAAEERPGFVDPLMFLANVQERRGDFDAARNAYTRALDVDATLTAAGVALALTYAAQDRDDEARQWLERLLQSNPGFEPTVFNLGMLSEHEGRAIEAADWYRIAAALDATSSGALMRLAVLSLAAGDTVRARTLAAEALARQPDDAAAAELLAATTAPPEAVRPLVPQKP